MPSAAPLLALLAQAADELQQGRLDPALRAALTDRLTQVWERGVPARYQEPVIAAIQRFVSRLEPVRSDPAAELEFAALHRAAQRALAGLRFARRLRELRLRAGLSGPALARRAGMNRATLYRLEIGVHAPPRLETLRRLADALRVELAELETGGRTEAGLDDMVAAVQAAELFANPAAFTEYEVELIGSTLHAWRRLQERGWIALGPLPSPEARAVLRLLAEAIRKDDAETRRLRVQAASRLAQLDARQMRRLMEALTSGGLF